MSFESVAVWVSIVALALATAGTIIGVFFARRRSIIAADAATLLAVASLGAMLGDRWLRSGHGPALGFFEVAAGLVFVMLALVWALVFRVPGTRVALLAVLPISLLVLGGSLLASQRTDAVGGTLASFWLAIHVLFANLAFGCYAASFALAAAFLVHHSHLAERFSSVLERLPSEEELDGLTYRFVGAGFVFQTVMIVSGAIWANQAWGRYWGWDPIETWSLIAWAIYALYLHLTLTLEWRGRRAAWVAVAALPVSLFSLLGVPIVYHSIHGAYLAL